MNGRFLLFQRTYCWLVVWGIVLVSLILLSSCSTSADVVEPPQAPEGMAGVVVEVAPHEVALNRSDMPAGFQLAAQNSVGREYVALYLRPSALEPGASGGNALLSVLTSVGVYTTTADAAQAYLEASVDPTERAGEEIELVSDAATNIVTQPFEDVAQGADQAEAVRVSYSLMDQSVFEYGHRLRLGNVLAYVVVAALGDPDEPPYLIEDTRDLVQRQIDHIAEAAGGNPPE